MSGVPPLAAGIAAPRGAPGKNCEPSLSESSEMLQDTARASWFKWSAEATTVEELPGKELSASDRVSVCQGQKGFHRGGIAMGRTTRRNIILSAAAAAAAFGLDKPLAISSPVRRAKTPDPTPGFH